MRNQKCIYSLAIAIILLAVAAILFTPLLTSCDTDTSSGYSTRDDINAQKEVADSLAASQKTPTDVSYSLERYNLIRRTYWVNGQREKANTLVCAVEKPFSYIVLFSGNTVVGRFVVDGKVSSLNSFLTPGSVDKAYGGSSGGYTTLTTELADVDGSYGQNDNGIFFFTPDGRYIEWTGTYLYSDIPFEVDDPVVNYEVSNDRES